MNGATIVSVVAIGMALLLARGGLSARSMPRTRIWKMALAWLAIIVVVVLVVQSLGLEFGG